MSKVTSKNSRRSRSDLLAPLSNLSIPSYREVLGLMNNLQDWEVPFADKDKQMRLADSGTGKLKSRNTGSRVSESARNVVNQYDYLKEYENLDRLSSTSNSQDSFVDANSEKEMGNQYFKKQKFNEAIDCYSRSIALSPSAVAFANRAMAYIKIKRFQEAENDCTEALNLDDRYIKAYSRRATARKELGKLKEAIDDAEFALKLEPKNQELKKQYEESKTLLEKEILKKLSGANAASVDRSLQGKLKTDRNRSLQKPYPASSTSSGRVSEIDPSQMDYNNSAAQTKRNLEMDKHNISSSRFDADSGKEGTKRKLADKNQILRASVQELAAKAANVAKVEAAKNIIPPTSAYQFELSWRGISGDPHFQARLLKAIPPSSLPGLFKNALSASLLAEIIREDTALAIEYLQFLTQISRFDMIIMCLSSADKNDVTKIWDEVFSQCSADKLSNLRQRFGIKH